MNEPVKILNAEQSALVKELVDTYGIEPEEIIFFDSEKKPFLSYEATSALCNVLLNLAQIGVEPVASPMADSIAVKCTILTENGRERSAIGVANVAEQINETEISTQQAINLASSRALRNVLKAAGIDLLRRHREAMSGEVLDFKVKSNRVSLIGQAHILGQNKRLINGGDKTLWYHELWSRYRINRSSELTEEQLADFVAFLNGYEPRSVASIAA